MWSVVCQCSLGVLVLLVSLICCLQEVHAFITVFNTKILNVKIEQLTIFLLCSSFYSILFMLPLKKIKQGKFICW